MKKTKIIPVVLSFAVLCASAQLPGELLTASAAAKGGYQFAG